MLQVQIPFTSKRNDKKLKLLESGSFDDENDSQYGKLCD